MIVILFVTSLMIMVLLKTQSFMNEEPCGTGINQFIIKSS